MREYGPVALFGIVIAMFFLALHSVSLPALPAYASGGVLSESEAGTLLFGGDVMLGRAVERVMLRAGEDYPFEGVENIVRHADVAVVNFEAAVPRVHIPTPSHVLRFSVNETAVAALAGRGFDVLSLANNHSRDFGAEGLSHTRIVCQKNKLVCVGDPDTVNPASVTKVRAGSSTIGILALHATEDVPRVAELREALAALAASTDIQVAYVHWGDEYTLHHNSVQEELARTLIDLGVDAVVGHHPHVVQDIEIYKEKPIFYSLGNLIFDQYLDEHTETGLLIQMKITRRTVEYTLVPVSSIETPSRPQLMGVGERDAFVEGLIKRSPGVAEYMEGTALVVLR